MKKIIKYMLCLLGAAAMLSGCYKNDLAEMHNQLDGLNVRVMEAQVQSIKESLSELKDLSSQMKGVAENLNKECAELETAIAATEAELAGTETSTAEANQRLEALKGELQADEKAVKLLEEADVDGRIKEVEAYVAGLNGRMSDLQTASESFATLDMLAKVEAAIDVLPDDFELSNFSKTLEKSKNHVISWLFEDETHQKLFADYYTKSEIDAFIKTLNDVDSEHQTVIEELSNALESLEAEIRRLVIDAVEAETGKLEERIDGEIAEIEGRLDEIDRIIKTLDIMGTETLAIEGSIINAINVLNSRLGNLGDKTFEELIGALESDITLLIAADEAIRGGADEGVSLGTIKDLADKLASAKSVEELGILVTALQTNVGKLITSADVNTKLGEYLKSEDAKDTYALASAYSEFAATYENVVGKDASKPGTVLYDMAFLNRTAGNGSFTSSWTSSLTAAVNKLKELVGDSSVESQVNEIAEGLIDGIVKDIVGEGKSVSDIKAILDDLLDSFNTIDRQIGNVEKFKDSDDVDICTAIANIKTALENIAEKGHKHTVKDITDIDSAIEKFSGVLSNLNTYATESLVAAINELYDALGGKIPTTEVQTLISTARNILATAVLSGEGYDDYFATLNLTAIKADIDAIIGDVDDEKSIAIRAKSALDALNVEQFIKKADIPGYGFLTANEVDPAVVTALAAMEVAIGGSTFKYDEIDEAIAMVYGALQDAVGTYESEKGTYESLKARFEAIEGMIGGDDLFKTLGSIQSNIDTFNALFAGITGEGNDNFKYIATSLQDTYDGIVNALLGEEGTVAGITSENSIAALKNKLDNLGFDDFKKDGKTLDEVIDEISGSLTSIQNTVGDGYSASYTLAEALGQLKTGFEAVDTDAYAEGLKEFGDSLDELIDFLNGEESKIPTSITAINNDLKTYSGRLDALSNEFAKGFENVVANLNERLDLLKGMVLDSADKLPEGYDLLKAIDECQTQLENVNPNSGLGQLFLLYINSSIASDSIDQFSSFLLNYFGTEKGSTVHYEVFSINIFGLRIPILQYRPAATYKDIDFSEIKGTLVEELNSIFDKLEPISGEDLSELRSELLGDETLAATIGTLSEAIVRVTSEIGAKPRSFSYSSIFDALDQLERKLKDELGTNETEYETVWEAIKDLKSKVGGDFDKMFQSMVAIPEYSDGSVPVRSAGMGRYQDLTISFRVNANAVFAAVFGNNGNGMFSITGRINGGTTVTGTASYADGIMNVTFPGNQLRLGGSNSITVTITDERNAEASPKPSYTTAAVPLYIVR